MFESILKALGEPTRLRIVRLLAERELCVCELEEIMDMSQPRISQHLKVLKQAGLIKERREAQRRMCRLNREVYNNFLKQLDDFMRTPLDELPGFEEDAKRLKQLTQNSCREC